MKSNRNFYKKDLQKVFSIERPEEFLKFWKIYDETIIVINTDASSCGVEKKEYKSSFTKECKEKIKNNIQTVTIYIYTKNNYNLAFFIETEQKDFKISNYELLK